MAEVWFRNPDNYIRELRECGVHEIAFDRGYLVKRTINPVRFADLYYPKTDDFRVLAIGAQGTAEYNRGSTYVSEPNAVYPTWNYLEETLGGLEDLMANPVGENPAVCGDHTVPPDERPVLGQEHRVVVVHLPVASSGPGRRVLRELSILQADYPDCILHIHALYSFRAMFSNKFASVDVEARLTAKKGKVILPNGKEMSYEQTRRVPQWVTMLGMSPVDLEKPQKRCIYIIKSAQWAAKHFNEPIAFKSAGEHVPDVDSPTGEAKTVTVKGKYHPSGRAMTGDKFVCDACSLAKSCKYYREGSVCTLPGSEPSELARTFATRSADDIIDGLGKVMAAQANRLTKGLDYEDVDGELDPEVTRIVNSMMTHGRKLAILLNPGLANPKFGVVITPGSNGGEPTINKAIIAKVFRELEASGIPKEKINMEMVMQTLAGESVADPEAIAQIAADVSAGG
jgi:hypothetical protein